MRRRILIARVAAIVVTGALLRAVVGCATASTEPGVVGGHCGVSHDCGPTSGNDGGLSDGDELPDSFGFDVPHIDGPGTDTRPPPGDTTTPPDDTGTTSIDTGPGCPIPSGKACGWIPQCGCAAGQNCDFTAVDGTVSCEPAGSVPLNGKCSKLGDCGKGLTCIAGICMAFCGSAADCSSESGSPVCHAVTDGGSPPKDVPGDLVCMQQCDPRSPASVCGSGVGCALLDDGNSTCTAAGTGGDAADCTSSPFTCAPGLVCVNTGSTTSECLAWCRVGSPGDCSGGLTCVSFSTPAMWKGTEYGVCN